jgi:hypothetical protein
VRQRLFDQTKNSQDVEFESFDQLLIRDVGKLLLFNMVGRIVYQNIDVMVFINNLIDRLADKG